MLDLSAIDEDVERFARELPEIEKERRHQHPFRMPELRRVLDPPTWTGVSWVFHWKRHGDYQFRKLCLAELARAGTQLGAGPYVLEHLLPGFGFDNGEIELPYGRRGTLRLSLEEGNEVTAVLRGHVVASLPGPLKGDDADEILKTRADVIRLRTELRRINRLLVRYMAQMMSSGTHWTEDAWRLATAKAPFRHVASTRVFAAFGDPTNRFRGFFALDETGEAVGLDHSRISLDRCIIRVPQPGLFDDDDRHRWGAWFAEHRRTGVWLDDRAPVHAGYEPERARICGYGWFDRVSPENFDAVNRQLDELGWRALPWPDGDRHWRGTPWFDKQLGPDGPWATFLANGGPTHVNHIALVYTSDPFCSDSEEEDWLTHDKVHHRLLAEVLFDIDEAGGRHRLLR